MSTMYDSVEPQLIPTTAAYLAVYVNGFGKADIAAVAKTHPHARIFQIDVNGSVPSASIKDVETGDITVEHIPQAVEARFKEHPDALTRIYCNLSTWPDAKAMVKHNVPSKWQD